MSPPADEVFALETKCLQLKEMLDESVERERDLQRKVSCIRTVSLAYIEDVSAGIAALPPGERRRFVRAMMHAALDRS